MNQVRFKELFETSESFKFWRYVSYYQESSDQFYYEKGYNYYYANYSYPKSWGPSNNPYKKGSDAYKDYSTGFEKAFSEDEYAFSKRPL